MTKIVSLIALLPWMLITGCSDDNGKPSPDAGHDGPQATEVGTHDGPQITETSNPDGPEVCEELLPESFPEDTVLLRNCYLCKKTPKITDGVKITMEPGVKIVFFPQTGLDITDNDVLIAAGTATLPIIFTGSEKVRGHWKGLVFGSTLNTDSTLDHVIIEYAGDTITTSNRDAAGIRATADSRGVRFSMTNTIIRESQGWGLYLGGAAVVGAFGNNTLTKNTLGPGYIASEVVNVLDSASTYKGNDRDELYVPGWRTKGTWATLDVPYYVDGPLSADGDWTIEAGTTLIMADGSSITISDDEIALIAQGTTTKPILFTASTKQRGAWKGIHFNGSNNTRNTLAYATVEYAGNTTSDKDAAAVKLTSDSSGVQLSMTNTIIQESQGWGLFAVGSAILPGFASNTLTKNTLGPVSISSEAVHQLLPLSSYSGNDVDRVMVQGGYVSTSVIWQDLKIPYLVNKYLAPNHAVLSLAPGVTLLMADGGFIDVGGDDTGFHAVGTATAPITITSLTKTPGIWESIVFDNTINGANALDYCTIEYGGGGAYKGWGGMIHASSDSSGVSVSIKNSQIQNSAVFCIWQNSYAQLDLSGTTFANCASGNVYQD